MNLEQHEETGMKKIKKRIALAATALFVTLGGYQFGKNLNQQDEPKNTTSMTTEDTSMETETDTDILLETEKNLFLMETEVDTEKEVTPSTSQNQTGQKEEMETEAISETEQETKKQQVLLKETVPSQKEKQTEPNETLPQNKASHDKNTTIGTKKQSEKQTEKEQKSTDTKKQPETKSKTNTKKQQEETKSKTNPKKQTEDTSKTPNQKQSDTDKSKTPTKKKPTNPVQTEAHQHQFKNWTSINDSQEQGLCSCGEIKIQFHHNIIKTFTKNKDAKSYQEITRYTCTRCGHISQKSKVKKYRFGEWKYNPKTKKDERVCKDTGYRQTKRHVHVNGAIEKYDAQYEYRDCTGCGQEIKTTHALQITENFDGSKTYRCTHQGCGYQQTVNQHQHNFTKLKSYTNTGETWECDCGANTTKNHTLGKQKIDKTTHQVVEECQNPGCDYEKRTAHTPHTYTTFKGSAGDQENWECTECGQPIKKNHTLGSKTLDKTTHEVVEKCQTPGCDYEKRTAHTPHTYTTFKGSAGNQENWECECGAPLTKAHTLGEKTFDKTTHEVVQECQTPGCDYEIREAHTPHTYAVFKGSTGEQENWKCDCGAPLTKAHTLGAETFDKATHEVVRECETPGCDYETRQLHTDHHFDTFKNFEGTEEYWECDCGETTTKSHQLTEGTVTPGTHNKVKECQTPGCDYEEVELVPEHNYVLQSTDENYEYYQCSGCESTKQEAHSFNSGVPQGDGTYLQTCENEGCGYTRSYHTCIEGTPVTVFVGTKDVCYRVRYDCKICGKTVSYGPDMPHVLYRDWDTNSRKCSNTGCAYEEALSNSLAQEQPSTIKVTPQETTLETEVETVNREQEVPTEATHLEVACLDEKQKVFQLTLGHAFNHSV